MAKEIINKDKYTYNQADDKYVIQMKHRVKPYVIHGYKIRAIKKAISNLLTPSISSADIKTKYKLQEADFEAIKKAFDLTRDTFPLTDEEVDENSLEHSAENLLEEKRTAIVQSFEKKEWKDTQEDAQKWREFENGTIDPIKSALDGWTPPKIDKLTVPKFAKEKESDDVLVIGLSDLHYGSASKARYMYNRPEWTTEKTVECVKVYAQKIIDEALNRARPFRKALILGLGDLIHSLNGKTTRGTELNYDCIKEEQFEYALTSLFEFIGLIAGAMPAVDVHSVYGNHNYETEMALFRALEKAFMSNPNIKFHHYSSRPASFKEGTTLFLCDHGADHLERVYVPTATDSKIQQHVQSLLLCDPELLVGTKERLFVVGDKHHWEHIEYNDFQFIMFGCPIGGDEHSSRHNLRNRPRQSFLVLNNDGLKEVHHVYFD